MKSTQKALAEYAFKPLAKVPSKKFPLQAFPKTRNAAQTSNGILLASVEDQQSPISSLALVLPSGTRMQSAEQIGAANWLKFNAFKTTNTQSSIKITRESEILGHSLSTTLTRESLVLQVDFRRDDLPDVVSLLADVLDGVKRRDDEMVGIYPREFVRKSYEWRKAVEQAAKESANVTVADRLMDAVHLLAFRRGLAAPLYPRISKDLDIDEVLEFCEESTGVADKVAIVGYGVDFDDLSSAAEHFFSDISFAGESKSAAKVASKYYGGETVLSDVAPSAGVEAVIAFNGVSKADGDYATSLTLRALLGSNLAHSTKFAPKVHSLLAAAIQSSSACVDSFSLNYSDAGLFGVYVSANSAADVNSAIKSSLDQLKAVASGKVEAAHVAAAIAKAKFQLVSQLENGSRATKLQALADQLMVGDELLSSAAVAAKFDTVDAKKVASLAGRLLKSRPSVATAGNLFEVVHADELGL
eukprot:Partr_v1_DN26566_c0_g1_i1_m3420 putative ubiquinol-cytochrome c reductase core protein II